MLHISGLNENPRGFAALQGVGVPLALDVFVTGAKTLITKTIEQSLPHLEWKQAKGRSRLVIQSCHRKFWWLWCGGGYLTITVVLGRGHFELYFVVSNKQDQTNGF